MIHKNLLIKLFSNTKIDESTNCWLYQGDICPTTKYGRIQIDGIRKHIHRLSCIIYFGESNLLACHTCSNRHCWNPAHLYWGSNQENQMDVWKENLCKQGHDLKIHGKWARNINRRYCGLCHRLRTQQNYLKRKARLISSPIERVG